MLCGALFRSGQFVHNRTLDEIPQLGRRVHVLAILDTVTAALEFSARIVDRRTLAPESAISFELSGWPAASWWYWPGTDVEVLPLNPKLLSRAISYLWTLQRRSGTFLWSVQRTDSMTDAKKSEVLHGTLDLMILKTLHALGPQHGFGIARRIEQVSRDVLQLNEGTVYTSLLRLLQEGWIVAAWGTSDNNRKAKFYSITARGQKQLAVETENWERISGVIGRVLRLEPER